MKKKTIVILCLAAALIVLGAAVCALAVGMGAQPKELFREGAYVLDLNERGGDFGEREGSFGERPGNVAADISVEENNYTVDGDIEKLSINWVSGRVQIAWANVETISFYERSSGGDAVSRDEALEYQINGKELEIDWCEEENIIGFDFDSWESKDLVVRLPHGLKDISVDTTSAAVDLQGFTLDGKLRVSTTSGEVTSEDISADSVSFSSISGDIYYNSECREFAAETTSGKITFSGVCRDFEADTTSGKVEAEFTDTPNEISANTVSGAVELTLPLDAAFELEFDTVSGGFDCDFAVKKHDGDYVAGQGGAEMDVDTVSGGLKIKSK